MIERDGGSNIMKARERQNTRRREKDTERK